MMALRFPERSQEYVSFALSPFLETILSWHVLVTPRHHPLQLPWVRACRTLPHATRTALRDFGQIVRAYVPMFGRGLRFYPTFEEEVEEIRSLDIDVVTAELAVALAPVHGLTDRREFRRTVGEQRFLEAAPGDSPGHERIRELFDDPDDFRDRILDILTDYWQQAFSKEWARLEESILDRVESAGSQLATEGLESLLVSLIPEVRVDDAGRTVRFERPHRHDVDVAARGGVTLFPSFYTWPHVRVECDPPWPLTLTYPIPSLRARRRRAGGLDKVRSTLRALSGDTRLEIVHHLSRRPHSTQELANLVSLSPASVSRHLKELEDAGLTASRREGYYVLYELRGDGLRQLADALEDLAERTPTAEGSEGGE